MAHEHKLLSGKLLDELRESLAAWDRKALAEAIVAYNVEIARGTAWNPGDPSHKGFRTVDGLMAGVAKDVRVLVKCGRGPEEADGIAWRHQIEVAVGCIRKVGWSDEPMDGFWVDPEGLHKVWRPRPQMDVPTVERVTDKRLMEFGHGRARSE